MRISDWSSDVCSSDLSLPALLRALEILTGVFAMTPMIYYRRTAEGKERVETSPLFTLFHDRPNDVQSAFLFKEVILGDMLMAGRFATYIHRDGMFRPTALSRVNPLGVQPVQYWDRTAGQIGSASRRGRVCKSV